MLEVIRTETRGKTSCEWVRLTPAGVDFLHEHESPLRALEALRDVLKANREAVPVWLESMRQELRQLSDRLEGTARGCLAKLDGLARHVDGETGPAVKGTRRAYFRESSDFVETTVYDRARLVPGDEVRGPAVVEEEGSTLVIGPGGSARVAGSGNLVVTLP